MLCSGDKPFCNGLDVNQALPQPPNQMRDMFLILGDLVVRMLEAPVPIVGSIKGHAIGAGKTLLSACDYRYAASGRVLIGVPEILLGVANTLAEKERTLKRGDYITTGSVTAPIPVKPGQHVVADFHSLGKIELRIDTR